MRSVAAGATTPKVSVVVALYNTGPGLADLVASLDAQTLPFGEYEVVLVDDGSTDDTLRRARELAAVRPHCRVETIPNSGWPGRPRNVGIDVARGDYVFFSDHDDRFGPLALERLVETAQRTGADIVYGKIVRIGLPTPYWTVWQEDVDHADPTGPVMTSRTVHKLYRRAFLLEHGLRFREGRTRLEDHEFMARAIPVAGGISVLASVPCYVWIQRPDRSNNSSNPIDPEEYWGHYTRVLQVWADAAGPGPLLDAARVTSLNQAFTRYALRGFDKLPIDTQKNAFRAIGELVRAQIPPEVDAALPVLRRTRVKALRADDIAAMRRLQDYRARFTFEVRTVEVRYEAAQCHVVVAARLLFDGSPCALERSGTDFLLPMPAEFDVPDADRRLLPDELGTLELTVRHRELGIEWPLTGTVSRPVEDGLELRVDTVLDMVRTRFGDPFDPGWWDVEYRVQFLGESRHRKVAAPAVLPEPPEGAKSPQATRVGLAFKVMKQPAPRARLVAWDGRGSLRLTFDACTSATRVALSLRKGVARGVAVDVHGSSASLPVVLDGAMHEVWARGGGAYERVRYDGPAVVRRRGIVRSMAWSDRGRLAVCVERLTVRRVLRSALRRVRRRLPFG
jgi:hypothetical protein